MSTPTTPTPIPSTRAEEATGAGGGAAGRSLGDAALARVLAPARTDEFLAEYWERKPLSVPRGEDGRFDDLLSEADAEALVCSGGMRYPAFRLVKAGEKLDVRDYTVDLAWRPAAFTGAADVERVLAEFESGATIVLQALHLHWRPLAEFSRALEAGLGHPVQANAYYTPRRSQGLPVHHDTHDVFVLQVAGDKRWLVYEPALELPLKDQRYSPELGGPGDPVDDLVLTPGDTLYLPRGWLHEALTSESDSLHLTIGVNVYTWLDAFKAALSASEDDVEFRRSVPPDGRSRVDLVERLRERLAPADVSRRRRERFHSTRRPVLDGQLTQLRALDGLALDSPLERRPTVLADVAVDADAVSLAFEGKRLDFPVHARAEIEFAAAAPRPFTARELPGGLDDESRLVVVRRLVREGFLRLTRVRERGARG
ncbi:MAG TPA: cupin domain-containing protein [Gaiellaceae bacterium]|nr:cupin domain-containing protein [Gaiellaceae bacterium]